MKNSDIEQRIEHYKKRAEQIAKGTLNNIPFRSFPSLNKVVPGIIPRIMYKVTSHSGINSKIIVHLFYENK